MRPTLSTAQFHALARRIADYSGFLLDGGRHRSLESALAVRMEALGLETTAAYLQRLDDAELHRLTELVVNHETQFFRTPAHHRALREQIIPAFHRERPQSLALRCWSAGCSTGEEPYSIAISALEVLGDPPQRAVEIFATDISSQALARALEARYRGRALTNVAAGELQRYFTREPDGSYVLKPAVRALVRFEQHNLQEAFPAWARALDIIFCQNVTIYFSVETCRLLMSRFYDALTPGGYLVLGYSETLWRIFDRFETVEVAGAFVYRKPLPRVVAPRPTPPERRVARQAATVRPPRRPSPPTSRHASAAPPVDHLEQGLALLRAGALEQALAELQRVPVDHARYPQALAAIARIHADRGEVDMAAAEARRAIELDPLTHEAHLLLGMLAANREDWDEAVRHLERVRYLDPTGPLPSFHLANAYRGQQRRELAMREYRSTLRKLELLEPTAMLDGVTVAWLRETCQRYLQHLERDQIHQR